MQLIGKRLILAVPMPAGHSPADTTARVEGGGRFMHHHFVLRVIGAVIWLGVVIYLLWLGTRAGRAIEKVADKFQGRAL